MDASRVTVVLVSSKVASSKITSSEVTEAMRTVMIMMLIVMIVLYCVMNNFLLVMHFVDNMWNMHSDVYTANKKKEINPF
jgi:hypothetical protein